MKKILKEKIINEINTKGFYEITGEENIEGDKETITLLNNRYNIYFIECMDCGEITNYITNRSSWMDLYNLLNDYGLYYYNNNGDVVCNNCFNDNYFYCTNCDTLHRIEDGYETRDDGYVCENCYYDYYSTCDDCGDVVSRDYVYWSEDGDYCYCENCYNQHYFNYGDFNTDQDEIIGNIDDFSTRDATCGYHDNPIPFEKRKSNRDKEDENLFFGVELETSIETLQGRKNASCYIAKNLNCRIETDSSVCGYSMEIISDPQTFKKWEDRRNKIDTIFNNMINYGITSHNNNTCGLHIHISRDGLGTDPVEQERVINNIYLILENFKSNLIKLSRREESQLKRWGCFLSDFDGSDKDLRDTKKIKDNNYKTERYVALNLNNSKTIEFRFFRGTLKTSTFYATLQLIKNIIEIAKKEDVRGISFKHLINLNGYADLIEYSKERGCDNSITIIDKGFKNKYQVLKEENENLRKYYKFENLKNEIIDYLLDNREIIDFSYNYNNRNSYSIMWDIIQFKGIGSNYNLIGENASKILNLIKYKAGKSFITKNKKYYMLEDADLKTLIDTYKELKAIIKEVK